jgi:hypothetical protein
MSLLPTKDKEARIEINGLLLKFIKTLRIELLEDKPDIIYDEVKKGKCVDSILELIEKRGYHKGIPSGIEETMKE